MLGGYELKPQWGESEEAVKTTGTAATGVGESVWAGPLAIGTNLVGEIFDFRRGAIRAQVFSKFAAAETPARKEEVEQKIAHLLSIIRS